MGRGAGQCHKGEHGKPILEALAGEELGRDCSLSGCLAVSLYSSMTLSHTCSRALPILISLLRHMPILAPSCWGWDMPVLSLSRGIYRFSPGVQVEPVGHQVLRDTTGWESGSQVREQGEPWGTCSPRPWKAGQASRAQGSPAANTTKAQRISPCLLNQSLQNTRWGESQMELKHHLVRHTPRAMRKLRPGETASLGPELVGLLDTLDLSPPSRLTFLFFSSGQSLFQHSVWSFVGMSLASQSALAPKDTRDLPSSPPALPLPPPRAAIVIFIEKSLLTVSNITITMCGVRWVLCFLQ